MVSASKKHDKTDSTMEGWIKLHKKIRAWQHYHEPSVLVVFLDILFSTSHKQTTFRGNVVEIGQTTISVESIMEHTGLSRNTVRGAIHKLVESGEIKREKKQSWMLTTVVKFSEYQGSKIDPSKKEKGSKEGSKINPNNPEGGSKGGSKIDPNKEEEDNIIINNSHTLTHAPAHTHEGWQLIEEVKNSASLEAWCMQNRTTKDTFIALATQVVTEWEITELPHKNKSDVKWHLFSSVKKLLKEKQNGNNRSTYEEQRDKLYADSAALIARLAAEDDARAAKVRNT